MIATICVTIVALLLPGALFGWVSGMRPMLALATAGPIMLGITGFSAWLAQAIGLSHSWFLVLAMWALFAALSYLVRSFIKSSTPSDSFSSGYLTALITAAVTLVATTRVMFSLAQVPGGAGAIREAWDMLWHTNFLRFIQETGNASPVSAGLLLHQETHSESFYPSGWHAMAALLPGDIFLNANVFSFLSPSLILPAGMALLARTVAGPKWATIAGPAAALLTLLTPEIWVALWKTSSMPYILAVACIPAATALALRGYIVPSGLAIVGALTVHPAAAITVALFVALWFITQPSVAGLIRTALIGVIAGAMCIPILLSALGQGESVAGFTGQIKIPRDESLWRSLIGMSSYTEDIQFPLVMLVLFAAGIVVALLRRHPWTPWPALAFGLLFMVSDSAQVRWSEPFGTWLKAIGMFYYDMPYRVQAAMGILRVLLAALAIAGVVALVSALVSRLRSRADRDEKTTSLPSEDSASLDDDPTVKTSLTNSRATDNEPSRTQLIAVGVAAAVALVPISWVTGPSERSVVRASFATTYVSDADKQALEWLDKQPHAHEGHILNDRKDGSAWMYAMYGLPSLYRHFSFGDKTATASPKLATNVDLLGVGTPESPTELNEYDVAARKLGVNYIFVSPPVVQNDGTEALAMRSWAWHSPGLTPVYRDGATVIFAVNAMFSPEELRQIVKSSPRPTSRPSDLFAPARQPIIAPPTETVDPLAGAQISVDSSENAVRAINDYLGPTTQLSNKILPGIAKIQKRVQEILTQRGATLVPRSEASASVVFGTTTGTPEESANESRPNRGFAVSAIVDASGVGTASDDLETDAGRPATWQLAAGLRDSMVYRGFAPDSKFNSKGRPTTFYTGLAPQTVRSDAPVIPTASLAFGSVLNENLAKDLKDPAMQEKWALAIVDGIASMLRQNPQLAADSALAGGGTDSSLSDSSAYSAYSASSVY